MKPLEFVMIGEDMNFVELEEEQEIFSDYLFDIDEFFNYWMDIADPRGEYLKSLEAFKFEQASGSGEWDY